MYKLKMKHFEEQMITELIRRILGRYSNNEDENLRFDFNSQVGENYKHNKKIIDLFDDYYGNNKIICMSWKGSINFIILKKEVYKPYLWFKLNSEKYISYWNNEEQLKNIVEYDTYIYGDYNGETTTKIILELIKKCNQE